MVSQVVRRTRNAFLENGMTPRVGFTTMTSWDGVSVHRHKTVWRQDVKLSRMACATITPEIQLREAVWGNGLDIFCDLVTSQKG